MQPWLPLAGPQPQLPHLSNELLVLHELMKVLNMVGHVVSDAALSLESLSLESLRGACNDHPLPGTSLDAGWGSFYAGHQEHRGKTQLP